MAGISIGASAAVIPEANFHALLLSQGARFHASSTKARMASIGKVLKDARIKRGLSQATLAKQAGMTAPQLARIEASGTLGLEFGTVSRIAGALGMSLDEIAHYADVPGFGMPPTAHKENAKTAILQAIQSLSKIERAAVALVSEAEQANKRLSAVAPKSRKPH